MLEQLYPIAFDYYRLRENSAGAGQFRGGFGVEFQVRLLRGEGVSSVIGDRGKFPPFGLQGGAPASCAVVEYTLGGKSYRPEHLTKDEGIQMRPGDLVTIGTPGGGGWGDPMSRRSEAIIADLQQELISPQQAESDYGVAPQRTANGVWEISASDDQRKNEAAATR